MAELGLEYAGAQQTVFRACANYSFEVVDGEPTRIEVAASQNIRQEGIVIQFSPDAPPSDAPPTQCMAYFDSRNQGRDQ